MRTLQIKVLETTEEKVWSKPDSVRIQPYMSWEQLPVLLPWYQPALPDGDGVSRSSSDVPAAVQSGRILERPTRTGDDTTGRPEELGHVAAG